ncbi:unnamed protein product [Musa acuminata subsp. burmannicoides]
MGWKWEDEENSGRGFGDIVNPNPKFLRSVEGKERCSTRRVVRSSCRTEEVEPGRFVRKCEKTEQTLRDCVGRPVEVVESKTEHTEDDVTDEVTRGSLPLDSPSLEPFNLPGLRRDIEGIEQRLFGGIGHFLEAAEEITNEFFKSLGDPSWRRGDSAPSGGPRIPSDRQLKEDPAKPKSEPEYSEYAGQMADV